MNTNDFNLIKTNMLKDFAAFKYKKDSYMYLLQPQLNIILQDACTSKNDGMYKFLNNLCTCRAEGTSSKAIPINMLKSIIQKTARCQGKTPLQIIITCYLLAKGTPTMVMELLNTLRVTLSMQTAWKLIDDASSNIKALSRQPKYFGIVWDNLNFIMRHRNANENNRNSAISVATVVEFELHYQPPKNVAMWQDTQSDTWLISLENWLADCLPNIADRTSYANKCWNYCTILWKNHRTRRILSTATPYFVCPTVVKGSFANSIFPNGWQGSMGNRQDMKMLLDAAKSAYIDNNITDVLITVGDEQTYETSLQIVLQNQNM